jgi:type IV pilus assembly protein PilV
MKMHCLKMNCSERSRKSTCQQGGFSLVEVLITLVIMSIGMLGIAGLYVQSMQAGRTSMFRHHAVTLASDVADRIRANPLAGVAYAAAGGMDNSCINGGVDCNAADMAANDILLWQEQADDSLPGGQVGIVFDGGVVPPTYQITISWSAPNPANQPPTYIITIPVRAL